MCNSVPVPASVVSPLAVTLGCLFVVALRPLSFAVCVLADRHGVPHATQVWGHARHLPYPVPPAPDRPRQDPPHQLLLLPGTLLQQVLLFLFLLLFLLLLFLGVFLWAIYRTSTTPSS